jgi:tRNA-specific 2-thiouridylase
LYGFKAEILHLGREFIEIVKKPKFGYGKNMNPCIDCKILMLKRAKEYMLKIGADFLVTGEVVGQRPKSQFRDTLYLIEKQAEVEGILLRPLTAKLLKPTIAEEKELVDREKLLNINGRSRKAQMELAEKYGLEDYPTPASGCLLTDPRFAQRLKDLLDHQEDIDFNDINLLRVGRHFRFDDDTRMVVGRNEGENDKIEKYYREGDMLFEALDTGSPIVILRGKASDEAIEFAARLTARYCDQKYETEVEVTRTSKDGQTKMTVEPFVHADAAGYQV